MLKKVWILPELIIAVAALAVMAALSLVYHLPISFPNGERSAFLGIHYIYPLAGAIVIAAAIHLYSKRDETLRVLFALPCYLAVLLAHFNLKLWIPHINPLLFDGWLWSFDAHFSGVVSACMKVREALWTIIPPDANAYMLVFIMMFYTSFIYHAVRTPERVRELIIAVMIMQFLGGLLYLAMPAIGPFVFEPGVNPFNTLNQQGMLDFYRHSVHEGPTWLAAHGDENFTGGLAAMPSLHNAGALLFLLFARAYGRPLVPPFVLATLFIAVASIASRWHYLLDLPAGWLLASTSYHLAHFICRREDRLAQAQIQQPGDLVQPLCGSSQAR